MKKNPIILLLMLALSSCIYKYTPDVSGEYGRVVIEGDISIGTVSHFSASRVIPLGVSFAGAVSPGVSKASFKVEDEDGTEYKEKGSTGDIDLSSASADKRYRLVAEVTVEGEDPVEYVSDWQYPAPAPEIGDLVETVVDDRLCLALNLSSDGGSGCYRWEYEELYKYRSPMGEPTLEFSVADTAIMDHSHASDISEVQRWWKYSWCWMETRSRRSAVAIAKALEGSNLVNHEFMTMERSSDKIAAGEYYIRLIARTIPEDQYLYLNAVNEGSENTGSLFSPLPGEQIGNIRNSKDPDDPGDHDLICLVLPGHQEEPGRIAQVVLAPVLDEDPVGIRRSGTARQGGPEVLQALFRLPEAVADGVFKKGLQADAGQDQAAVFVRHPDVIAQLVLIPGLAEEEIVFHF